MMSLLKSRSVLAITCAVVCFGMFMWLRGTAAPSQKFVVGMMNGWPPFMSINQAGDMEGFDVDVARLIAQRLGRELEIRDLGSVQTVMIALEQGSIDCAMSGLDNTVQRQKAYNMIRYTSRESADVALIFWKAAPAKVSSLADCAREGLAVAVEPGSAQDKYADTISGLSKVSIPAVQDMMMELRFGKVAAVALEPRVAARLCKQIPELVTLTEPLPDAFRVYGEGIAIKKTNTRCAVDVAGVVEALQADGTLSLLETAWQLEGGE